MTVREMIETLRQYDPDLPIALADWGEGRSFPCLAEAETIRKEEEKDVVNLPGEMSRRLPAVLVIGGDW